MKPAIAVLLPLAVTLAACTNEPPPPLTGEARANAATVTACRERGEAIYERQNRGAIYSINNRDSPFSANYTPEVLDRGLSQRFGYDQTVRDCVRNTGTQTNRTESAPATSAPATGPAKP